jgi:hypothetical protein
MKNTQNERDKPRYFNQGIFEFQSKWYLIFHELFSMFSFFFTRLLEESGYKSQNDHTITQFI